MSEEDLKIFDDDLEYIPQGKNAEFEDEEVDEG